MRIGCCCRKCEFSLFAQFCSCSPIATNVASFESGIFSTSRRSTSVFGRLTRFVAIAALASHLWVSMVVAPWHHLVAHRGTASEAINAEGSSPTIKHCHCRHHSHCASPKTKSDASQKSDSSSPLTSEHDEDSCPVCQVLAQLLCCPQVPAPAVALERLEFSPPETTVQPLLGSLIDPVSRGPPAV